MPGTATSIRNQLNGRLSRLEEAHPEWASLAGLVRLAVSGVAPGWGDAALVEVGVQPGRGATESGTPALEGAELQVDRSAIETALREWPELGGVPADRLTEALCEAVSEAAPGNGPASVAARYATIPLLEAAVIRTGIRVPSPASGWCPGCGAWPALAEVRGLEQHRMLRCGRCGGEWEYELLRCSFCGERDHRKLATLGSDALPRFRLDGCSTCQGYLKSATTLLPLSLGEILVTDLETVALDLAAEEAGYRRPPGLGFPLQVRLRLV